jgi:mannitol operon transcriptional antiterminator
LIALDSRSQSLLLLLLTAESKPASTQELAHRLGVTPRMVRYSLDNVEHWLSMQKVALLRRPGIGVLIDATPQIQRALLQKVELLEKAGIAYAKNERLQILLVTLLTQTEPITAKELQQQLSVSRTTVLKDLEKADQWLSNFDLVLARRQNVGCEMHGGESQIRRAFVYAILEGIEDAPLLELLFSPTSLSTGALAKRSGFIRTLIKLLANLNLSFYNQLVSKLCDEFELKLLDQSHAALVLDIAFQVCRVQKGRPVEETFAEALNRTDLKHTAMVNALAAKVKVSQGLTLADRELGYLTTRLEGARERGQSIVSEPKQAFGALEKNRLMEEIPADVLATVEAFVSAISLYLHPALQMDTELIRSLANHIEHIRRHEFPREQTPNPFYKSVIKQYGYVSQLVAKHAYLFNPLLQEELIESEIGYITMYVAASMEMLFIPSNRKRAIIVGDIPRATMSLLTSRLRFEFQNLDITGLLSYLDYHDDPFKYEHDLVISTHPINGASAPVVLVNPLLPPEDVARLAKYMRSDRDLAYPNSDVSAPKYAARDYRLKNLIDAKTVQCKVEAESWEEVVDVATQPLRRTHKIERRYVISIKEMIRNSGPYMVIWPGVALLHALPEDGVRELCMSLTTLRKPVHFGHEAHDPVEIAIVLGAIDKTSHLPALFDLNELVQSANARENLVNAYQKSRLMAVVNGFAYSHGR